MQEAPHERTSKRSIIDLALKAYLQKHPTVEGIDADFKEFAIAQIKLFIVSAHDTTPTGAVFTHHLLGKHPEVRAKVCDQQSRVFETSTAASLLVSTLSLSRLTYILAIIQEGLWLYRTVATRRKGDHHGTQYNPRCWFRRKFMPERSLVTEEDPLHSPKN
ncbi:MAG: hypothetical protein LQ344_006343 [Seirophora lacunosa]|nr:MAG: hypothetical protein LQ344_006343 [Seirophora lacunosa]